VEIQVMIEYLICSQLSGLIEMDTSKRTTIAKEDGPWAAKGKQYSANFIK
jgi:hypothetical protein